MPEGQYSGRRAVYVYKSDTGGNFLITLDETLGDIDELNLDKATATQAAAMGERPYRLRPRYVLWQGEVGGKQVRKRLICNNDSTAYQTASSTNFDIDGSTNGATTGRIGEKLTFLRVTTPTPTN